MSKQTRSRDDDTNPFAASKFVLGGHSFIAPLGSDAEASTEQQHAIVAACLANGIRVFDTTYAAERVAWARAIARCTSDEIRRATPIVWNFFGPLTEPLPGPLPWTAARWEEALAELAPWTGRPALVIHALPDPEANAAQIDFARQLKAKGRVSAVGHWPGDVADWSSPHAAVWDFVVAPWNIRSAARSRGTFAAARAAGRMTLGTSPFTRGWELDRIARRVSESDNVPLDAARRKVAGVLLRFCAFSPEVDRVVVAMRRAEYVAENLAALASGPCTNEEMRLITG